MTYTFTPEAAALATVPPDATAYLAVKGECHGHCGPRRDCCEAPLDPPADLAALVEQRCQTCDGCPPWIPFGPGAVQMACLKCHDGKPLHTIQHECRTCKGTRVEIRGGHYFDCGECDGGGMAEVTATGIVSLPGLWTYDELLPVLTPGIWPGRFGGVVGPDNDAFFWLLRERELNTRITVSGTPEPGHFVLAVTRRTL